MTATVYLSNVKGEKANTLIQLQTVIIGRENIPEGYDIDHINHDTLDNRKCNLRVISHADNNLNRKGKNTNNKSGYRNVFWNSGANKWQVSLSRNYRRVYSAQFDDVNEAGMDAERARKKYFGEFAGES